MTRVQSRITAKLIWSHHRTIYSHPNTIESRVKLHRGHLEPQKNHLDRSQNPLLPHSTVCGNENRTEGTSGAAADESFLVRSFLILCCDRVSLWMLQPWRSHLHLCVLKALRASSASCATVGDLQCMRGVFLSLIMLSDLTCLWLWFSKIVSMIDRFSV